MTETPTRTHPRLKSCLTIALIPVVLILVLMGVFIVNNRPPHVTVPTPKMPKDNGWDYFVRAGKMMEKIGHPGPLFDPARKPNEWTVAELKAFADDNGPALATVREGLTKQYHHPVMRSINSTGGPEYILIRETAKTLVAESLYYQRIGDWGCAMRSRLDAIELGAVLPKGGPILSGLVGVAIQAIGVSDIQQVVPRLDSDELKEAADRLDLILQRRASLSEILAEEANVSTVQFVEMFKGGGVGGLKALEAFDFDWNSRPVANRFWTKTLYAFGSKQRMVIENRDFCKRLAKELAGPYTCDAVKTPVPGNVLSQNAAQLAAPAHAVFAKLRAKLALLQLEIALRRHRLDTGCYPANLSDLTPKYLSKIPVDPFGGKALRYRVLDNGRDFLLYSIGPDLKDSGGRAIPKNSPNSPGDIVAGEY